MRLNSFLAYMQVFTDKFVTTLKDIALVGHPVHVLLLNLSVSSLRWIFGKGTPWLESCLLGKDTLH